MPALLPVLVPLINPNETLASLAVLHVQEGQHVAAGDLIATFETTKAAADLPAEREGFVTGLRYQQGDSLRLGELLCYLAEEVGARVSIQDDPPSAKVATPGGLRITRPALELAHKAGLNLESLPHGTLVTENVIRQYLADSGGPVQEYNLPVFNPHSLLVYGGGGHGKSLIELARAQGIYEPAGVVDDGLNPGEDILGVPVVGGSQILAAAFEAGARQAASAIGGLSDISFRKVIFDRLTAAGLTCPALIHPTAFVEESAELADGVQVFPHAYVGSSAQVGFGVIVNTGVILSHDVRIGAYSNISPGAILAGAVKVGERVLIGMGVNINLEVTIGAGARIGNGAVIKADVPAQAVVRAGHIWPE